MDTFSEIESLEAEIKSVQDEIDRRKTHPEEARDPLVGQEKLAALDLRTEQLNTRLTELVERSADPAASESCPSRGGWRRRLNQGRITHIEMRPAAPL
mgnify:FL=1